MSDIYPVDELVWENNNEGAVFRQTLLNLNDADPSDWQALLDALDEGSYNDQTLVAQFIGLIPDVDSLWAQLRLGEIKAMLCLALQDEAALDWVEWCLTLEDLTEPRLKHYRCVKALLEIKGHDDRQYGDYRKGLALLYGEQTAQDALASVEGETVFTGLASSGLALIGFEQHGQLLTSYDKLHRIKARGRALLTP